MAEYVTTSPTHALGRQAPTTIDSTAGGIGLTVPNGAVYAELDVETAPVRFTVDGTAPTTAVGRLVSAGGTIKIASPSALAAFKAIRTTATSASLQGDYWG